MSCPIEANNRSVPVVLHARTTGEYLLALLGENARGSVIAKFEHSLYARFGTAIFCCIGVRSIGAGPLNILLAPRDWRVASGVGIGQTVVARAGTLLFDDVHRVAQHRAVLWRPRPLDVGRYVSAVPARLSALERAVPERVPEVGLVRLAFPAQCEGDDDPVLRTARPAWTALERWLTGRLDAPTASLAPPPAASALIGLGPGLTPSGDDVVCGVLIALKMLGCDGVRAALWAWLMPQLERRTSDLSAAHLRAAAAGQGHSALHTVLEHRPADDSGLACALRDLGRVGHCSGWDALAGAALVWRAYRARQATTSRAASSVA
jgi:hypothetical protein